MKKILFIIWSHSLGGGAEALLTMLVNHLNPQKYQIGIMEVYHSEVKKEPVNPNIILYAPITFEGDREHRKKLYYMHREPEKIIRKYIPPDYDLYVSFNYQLPSFLLPEGTRNIAWVHGAVYDLAQAGMEFYRCRQRSAFEKARRIISISDITTKSIQDLFPECTDKLIEIYNAIDIENIRKASDSVTEMELKHPAIVCVGRLDENKNPLRVLKIFRKIAEENDSVHLYFLGRGELEPQLLQKSKEYKLQGKVHILGYVENPFPVIRQADVCCMASRSEGFPISLLECVALGVPFVSTEIGGARILADEGRCGRIYTTDEEAKDFIVELLNQPQELIIEKCKKSISRFDLHTYISRVEKTFDEVLESEEVSPHVFLWSCKEGAGELEERKYYYRFPEDLIPRGRKIILYGAGTVGTDYFYYIEATGICQVTAWVDAAAEKYRKIGKNVSDIDMVMYAEYDMIILAVMDYKTAETIRTDLVAKGVKNSRILWTKPIF